MLAPEGKVDRAAFGFYPHQCKMAREALELGVRDLAELAGVSGPTIEHFEQGKIVKGQTAHRIRKALEGCGVKFSKGKKSGIRLRNGWLVKIFAREAKHPKSASMLDEIQAVYFLVDATRGSSSGDTIQVGPPRSATPMEIEELKALGAQCIYPRITPRKRTNQRKVGELSSKR